MILRILILFISLNLTITNTISKAQVLISEKEYCMYRRDNERLAKRLRDNGKLLDFYLVGGILVPVKFIVLLLIKGINATFNTLSPSEFLTTCGTITCLTPVLV